MTRFDPTVPVPGNQKPTVLHGPHIVIFFELVGQTNFVCQPWLRKRCGQRTTSGESSTRSPRKSPNKRRSSRNFENGRRPRTGTRRHGRRLSFCCTATSSDASKRSFESYRGSGTASGLCQTAYLDGTSTHGASTQGTPTPWKWGNVGLRRQRPPPPPFLCRTPPFLPPFLRTPPP